MRRLYPYVFCALLVHLCFFVGGMIDGAPGVEVSHLLILLAIVPCAVSWGFAPALLLVAWPLLMWGVGVSLASTLPHTRQDFVAIAIFSLVGVALGAFGRVYRRNLSHHRRAEDRLVMAQRCAGVGTWDWDIATDTRYWSAGYRDIFGLSSEVPTSRESFRRSIHPDDVIRVDNALDEALVTGEYRVEYRLHPSRGERWILGVGRAMHDLAGRPIRMTGIVMDISALKRTGLALRETLNRYEALTESAPLGILLGNHNGKITYCNENWSTTTGLTLAETSGDRWMDAVYPADSKVLESWHYAIAASRPFEVELRLKTVGREPVRWHLVKGVPLPGESARAEQWLIVLADIHERKSYEELVKRLGDNLPDGAIYQIVHRAGKRRVFTYASAGFQGLFGLSPDEVVADPRRLYSLVLEEDRPVLEAAEELALREGRTLEQEFRQRTASGDIKWVLWRAAPQYFDDGSVTWNGVVIDITKRKRVEDALKRSEERFRLATKAVIGTIYDWDLTTGAVYRSEGVERLIGRAPDSSAVRSEWWAELIHPDDRDRVRGVVKDHVDNGPDHYTLEYRVRHDDGSWIDACDQGDVIRDGQGIARRIVGCITDTSEQRRMQKYLRESEEKFRTLADTLPQLVWSSLPSGETDYYNERWYEHTGVERGTKSGPFHQAWVHPEDVDAVTAAWRDSLSSGAPFEREVRLRSCAGGAYRWFIARALPIRGHEGRIERWFGTFTDVDEHRTLLEEREALLESERAARSEAEKASYSKDQFVAVLSHELRTPLHAILGWAQMMKRGRLDDAGIRQAIEVIEKNTRLQAQLISDLLDINRIVSGKIKLDLQDIELDAVIDSAVKSVAPSAESKGVEIVREGRVENPLIVGDSSRLQQVIWNLLSNAVKFSPKGAEIRIITERIERWIRLSVVDHGEGIEPDFVPKIFQRYTQADRASVRKHGGLGLGLSIVRHLVELHGGHVSVESLGKGEGSTFSVMLMMAPDDHRASPREVAARDEVRLAGVKVLVVDDEPDSRELIQRILVDSEATVTAVDGADQALATVSAFRPDVIVSDIGMPGKDGYTFVRELREREGTRDSTPAIALTAFARAEDRNRALRSGFQTHLAKPVDATELVSAIGALVRSGAA